MPCNYMKNFALCCMSGGSNELHAMDILMEGGPGKTVREI